MDTADTLGTTANAVRELIALLEINLGHEIGILAGSSPSHDHCQHLKRVLGLKGKMAKQKRTPKEQYFRRLRKAQEKFDRSIESQHGLLHQVSSPEQRLIIEQRLAKLKRDRDERIRGITREGVRAGFMNVASSDSELGDISKPPVRSYDRKTERVFRTSGRVDPRAL